MYEGLENTVQSVHDLNVWDMELSYHLRDQVTLYQMLNQETGQLLPVVLDLPNLPPKPDYVGKVEEFAGVWQAEQDVIYAKRREEMNKPHRIRKALGKLIRSMAFIDAGEFYPGPSLPIR